MKETIDTELIELKDEDLKAISAGNNPAFTSCPIGGVTCTVLYSKELEE